MGILQLNVRRVPRFVDVDEQIVKALAIEHEVERAHASLWLGHREDHITQHLGHWDEQDNIYIVLTGVAVLCSISSNYTDAIFGPKMGVPPIPANAFLLDIVPFYCL